MISKRVQWLTDDEWARIEPILPRGRKGAHRHHSPRHQPHPPFTLHHPHLRTSPAVEPGPTDISTRADRCNRPRVFARGSSVAVAGLEEEEEEEEEGGTVDSTPDSPAW